MPVSLKVSAINLTVILGRPTAITPAKIDAEAATPQIVLQQRNIYLKYPRVIFLRKTAVEALARTMVPVKPMTVAITARKAAVSPITDIPILKNAKAPALITVFVKPIPARGLLRLYSAAPAAPMAGPGRPTNVKAPELIMVLVPQKLARMVTLQA